MLNEFTFDLERTHPLSSCIDHIIHAALEPEVSILISIRRVTRHIPAWNAVILLIFTWVVPNLTHHGRPWCFNRQIPHSISRKLISSIIKNSSLHARDRFPHRTWSNIHAWIITDELSSCLRHPPCVVNTLVVYFHTPTNYLRIQRLPYA
ncbi:hypothetical protein D3C73_622860 [compost metagenome]